MIHVSDLLHIKRCDSYCWNSKYKHKEFQNQYHGDIPFYKIWTEFLGLNEYEIGQTGDSNEISFEKLNKNSILLMGRFEYNGCRTRIPLLEKIEEGYSVVYPFLSAYPKESEALIIKINDIILNKLGIHVTKYYSIYLYKNYIRKEELDLHEMLRKSDFLFNRRNRPGRTIKECIEAFDFDLDQWIEYTKEILSKSELIPVRHKQCTSSRRCIYYSDCFNEDRLEDDSVLFFTTSRYKLLDYNNGIRRICDIPFDHFDGFRLQYAQYMASKNGIFYDSAALKTWMGEICYPISYLDFEWDTFAIPPYTGMKPFDVLCFQYSLHVEEKDGCLKHEDFFEGGDCREHFIQSLIQKLPKEGSILVYNMEGAEKLRLMQLAEQFPKYRNVLERICSRMIDLSKPFEAGLFYDNRMRGHYSLKNILPVFTDDYSYAQLSIQSGTNAVQAYRMFEKADAEAKKEIRESIRKYCCMDTFAEYVVFHGLIHILKED